MPELNPHERLEWNEENLEKVLSDLHREAGADQSLHHRFMTEPFDVISSRIALPESYRGGIFAREKGKDTMVVYVAAQGMASERMPEGTSEETSQPDYEILCTVHPVW